MTTARISMAGFALLFLAASCSSSGGSGGSGNGGSTSTGGSNGSGSGGQSATGGSTDTGAGGTNTGAGGTPGGNGTGGTNTGAGGSNTGSGGVIGTGGSNTGSGGRSTGTGGSATGAGGSPTGSGGSTGTGGSSTGAGGSATGSGGSAPTQPTVVTSGSGAYWKTGGTLTASTGSATVTVNDTSSGQDWEGMGGAFNEVGWAQVMGLSAGDQTTAIDLLFGADAAHFVMARIPIGASDYALTRYTEDETANDTSMASFSISRDMMYIIPYVKAALAMNPKLRLWASPWTPPTWMKTRTGTVNGTTCGNPTNGNASDSNAFDGGCMNATSANLTAYALYFSKFVSAYKDQSINIEAVAPQNEPNYNQGYPSCLWNSADLTTFVGKNLGPAMNTAGVKVMLGTNSNGDSGKDDSVITAIEGDATAKSFEKMIGLQWGMLDNFEKSPSNYTKYGIPVWATEHKCGNYPWMTSAGGSGSCGLISCPAYVDAAAPNDQSYAVESWGYISKAIRAGVTAYNAWNMITDGVGKGNDMIRPWAQDALLTVKPSSCKGNAISSSLCATPAYYVFRHISQFAQAGGKVLTTSGGDAVAFKNPDGSEVAVVYNSGSANTAYTVAIAGKKYSFSMPAQGWATVFVPAGS